MSNYVVDSFQDNSAHGEDAFLIRELSSTDSLDVVLDGVTQCEGGYASNFTVGVLQDASIESLSDLVDAIEQVNGILFQTGKGRNLLTTVSAALKMGDELHVVNVGDSPVYLIRDGEITELTTISKSNIFPGRVNSAVGINASLTYEYKKVTLRPHDRLVLTTDGLMNNVFPEELLGIVGGATSPQEAISAIRELVSEKRSLNKGREDSYGTFREDDQTTIVRCFD